MIASLRSFGDIKKLLTCPNSPRFCKRTLATQLLRHTRKFSAHTVPIPQATPSPVPLLTQSDLDTYLSGLRSAGWQLRSTTKRFKEAELSWWQLHRIAKLRSFKVAMEYVNSVADVAKSERHHPSIHIYDRVNVDISLETHDVAERMTVSENGSPEIMGRWPGLTLRDVRSAMLINLIAEQCGAVSADVESQVENLTLDELLTVRIQ